MSPLVIIVFAPFVVNRATDRCQYEASETAAEASWPDLRILGELPARRSIQPLSDTI